VVRRNVVAFAKHRCVLLQASVPRWGLRLARNRGVDAIEILNGAYSTWANRLARDLAKTAGCPALREVTLISLRFVFGYTEDRLICVWMTFLKAYEGFCLGFCR
jgi:hypothetical protein